MPSPEHSHPNYLAVWVWLALLMLVSVCASYLPAAAVVVLSIILGLSFIKALLVALYYMHLKFEGKLLLLVVVLPLVLAAVLVVALLPDSAHARRSMPPPSASPDTPHEPAPAAVH